MAIVIKLGGSLLDRVSFVSDVRHYLSSRSDQSIWIIVGGGELVEQMRTFDQRFQLDSHWMHWHCIELLQTTFELTSQLLPELHRIETIEGLIASVQLARPQHSLVAIKSFYQRETSPEIPLPESWDTTSDSLAGLLALMVQAEELVLLKSCPITSICDESSLIQAGIVDRAFAKVNESLKANGKLKQFRVEQLPITPSATVSELRGNR